jgi:membrane protease YdiL (CAAX protease family)
MLHTAGWLWLECVAVYVAVPALFALGMISTPSIFLPLLLLCLLVALWLGKSYGFKREVFWNGDASQERQALARIIRRFMTASPFLTLLAWLFMPAHFLDLPRTMPLLWLLIIVVYPLLSVYPQELLFRGFFFARYQSLFGSEKATSLASALLFSWMHIVFVNVYAVSLALIGGWFFATTYRQTRSLRLVCLEHSLYGALLFTLGYGRLFVLESDIQLFLRHFGG